MRTTARAAGVALAVAIALVGPAGAALACGGLIAPNGTISLTRTTTLAAYHGGIEHYITSFQYAGATGGDVGSIVPLPGVPTDVIKGGDWTLQRLELEVHPPQRSGFFERLASAPSAGTAQVILKTTVGSLDITVLKGGALAVGKWARDHGFFLPPDAPQVLDFYAQRSPIFMAVKFSAKRAAAQGITEGEGTPVDVVIPTPHPWVPLRILTLGQKPDALVKADVFLLTDRDPAILPLAVSPDGLPNQEGLIRRVSEPASASLLDDLRRDKRMGWVPDHMWLSYIDVNQRAADLTHDLAIDDSGFGRPDPLAAGYFLPGPTLPTTWLSEGLWAAVAVSIVLLAAVEGDRWRRSRRAI